MIKRHKLRVELIVLQKGNTKQYACDTGWRMYRRFPKGSD
jgi:hypothetical protein